MNYETKNRPTEIICNSLWLVLLPKSLNHLRRTLHALRGTGSSSSTTQEMYLLHFAEKKKADGTIMAKRKAPLHSTPLSKAF